MEVVTFEILFETLKKLLVKRGMDIKEVKDLAFYILSFFGFGDYVVDNMLAPSDRHVFNMLEEMGILRTFEDEVNITRGKIWRIHYWTYRKDVIEHIFTGEEEEEEENLEELYDKIFKEHGEI